ncbi:MAG: proline--tRNA ligase [Acidobacteriota bacterium]|nr:proline--tRNA ligase [Acidobacteriota bacterium]MDH3529741.1 proline--tRNA ligase [Acidobacteriota bacterium]
MSKSIPTREDNYSEWYNEIVKRADLAEHSPVRGCMVIKPYGFAIWEKMQKALDDMFKETGHQNAYFPLFVPKSFLELEEQHAEGFAKECAVVTHYRLKSNPDGKGLIVDENSRLEEPLVVRPTSEAVIWHSYKNWIQSWRDLPVLINQWSNVVRWEMRTRLFLRTSEFLWQEGHTAHETEAEALEETGKMLGVYAEFVEQWMAVPVLQGVKTASERFAGAIDTYCIEALMQDGKALQAGTSHFLGQNFARSFDVKFVNKENELDYPWATSWGVSTRLIGALIMAHSDDKGLVLPPKLAPIQVVIVPIFRTDEDLAKINEKVEPLLAELKAKGIPYKYDDDDKYKPGYKFAEYELKGVPVRMAIGLRDLENGTIELARRDELSKQTLPFDGIVGHIESLLAEIQQNLYDRALSFREANTFSVDTWDAFKARIEQGGFVLAHWDGTDETEEKIKQETKATIRLIPLNSIEMAGKCVYSGKESAKRVVFARAY